MSPTKKFLLTRPHFAATAVLYIIILFIIITTILSSIATMNIEVNGRGTISVKERMQSIYTPQEGILEKIFVNQGDFVKKDQVLGIIFIEDFPQTLISPVNGRVNYAQNWNEKAFISTDDPVFKIVPQSKNLIAKIEIPSSQMKNIKLDQVVQLNVDAYPYRSFGIWEARIYYISATTNINKKGEEIYEVFAAIDKEQADSKTQKLIVGQSFNAKVIVKKQTIANYLLSYIFNIDL